MGMELGHAVAELLRPAYHSLAHALVAQLPVDQVVTTNYDVLYVHALCVCACVHRTPNC